MSVLTKRPELAERPVSAGPPASGAPWYREPIAWLVFGIPAIAVVSGGAMLYLSQVNYDGVVVDDYYKRGLAIDREFSRDTRAGTLRISGALTLTRAGTTSLDLEPGLWQPSDQVTLKLVHPTRPGLDQVLSLVRRGESRYIGPGIALVPGNWHVEVSAGQWRLRSRVHVDDGEEVAVLSLKPLVAD